MPGPGMMYSLYLFARSVPPSPLPRRERIKVRVVESRGPGKVRVRMGSLTMRQA